MQLWALQRITEGIESLAELEEQHPVLGQDLKIFVSTVNRCCRDAYRRFGTYLDDVLTLASVPSNVAKWRATRKLRKASDSKWFRDVANICDDLAAIANTYDADVQKHINDGTGPDPSKRHSLSMLLEILHKHEGDLKDDIRRVVDELKVHISNSNIAEAKELALNAKSEIDSCLTRINGVAIQITGSSSEGANEILTREELAEDALRQPFRVLLLNMALVVILLILGAAILNFVSPWAFPLLSGFVLTAVIVLNAFYLRSIDKLREETFMELMKLALLKFFAPLTRPTGG